MIIRFRILITSLSTAFFLLLMLCLGSQNLTNRHSLKIGATTIAPLPTGFLVGTSIILGVISGGSAAALLLPIKGAQKASKN